MNMPTSQPVTPELSVVIPCFNEEAVLPETLRRVCAVCEKAVASYEVLIVDDGSRDRTWEVLVREKANYPHVRGIRLSRNFGHQIALTCGLHNAAGQRILILDGDLQDPPELLPDMMKVMDQGYDIVYGQRRSRKGESFFKLQTATLFYWFINLLSDVPIPRDTGDFRLVSRRALDAFIQLPEMNRFVRGLFSWVGFKQKAFPYERDERKAGETKYTLRKMLHFAVDAITGFSIRPLKIALFLSFFMAFLAILGAAWTVYSWYLGGTVQGWSSLLTASFLIGACQLLVLGIIGEYLGRLFLESKRRPPYIIESHLD